MFNKLKIITIFIITIMLSVILPIINVYAYTVDDVRDILGKARVDDTFTESEIAEIIRKYNEIERANLIAKMFELSKIISIDSNTESEYLALDKEINSLNDKLFTDFKSGGFVTDILITNTKLDSALHKVNSLKAKGLTLEIEYIENRWEESYLKVQEVVQKMSEDYEIGIVGEGLRSPVYSGFMLTSPFGFRLDPITLSELTFHNGIDLSASLDDPIMSLWNGVVTDIYTTDTGGLSVEVTHGVGLISRYLHMNYVNVKQGQEITQYQVIGGAGDSGSSTGIHLHLTVELDGEKINPIYLFGSQGLNAFKTYLSYNPDRNRELLDIQSSIKPKPTKEDEVVEKSKPRYERIDTEVDNEDNIISTTVEGGIEVSPYNPSKSIYKMEDTKDTEDTEDTEDKITENVEQNNKE